jgi:NAD(P)H-dependent flavin oxidoreductase YrpB (nitropropane dioxygenase family)
MRSSLQEQAWKNASEASRKTIPRKRLVTSSTLGRMFCGPETFYNCANTSRGTGVGLINKVQPAGEIVREVREEAKRELQRAAGLV